MDNNLITIFGAILIIAIFGVAVYIKFRFSAKKENAKEFLIGLEEHITTSISYIIKEFKPNNYESLEEYETSILNKIYDDMWDYVETEAKIACENNQIASALISIITKDMVINFVNQIIENIDAIQTIKDNYVSNSIETSDIESQDKAIEEKFSDQSEYVEESNNDDLAPAEEVKPTEEESSNLNPQREGEEKFDIEDDSMELITEKPEIISVIDKNGNTLYYEVSKGKKKRVTKDYALKSME